MGEKGGGELSRQIQNEGLEGEERGEVWEVGIRWKGDGRSIPQHFMMM